MMRRIEAGTFLMGSDCFCVEEAPSRQVSLPAFWMDTHEVTNTDFALFVMATGYVTLAERPLDPAEFPGAPPDLLHPGGLVFQPSPGPIDLHDVRQWWRYTPRACWRRPDGPDRSLDGWESHPVVQVAYEDAEAYAHWAGKRLPSEAEWEFAARGGLEGAIFAWGDDMAPGVRWMANTWQGAFPLEDLASDGYAGRAPVGAFPPNGYGLYDMTGNVWEWTTDDYAAHAAATSPCCTGYLSDRRQAPAPKVIKGGSYLCAPNYCIRYRPAARQPQSRDTATCHIGFRCARS